MKPNLRLLYRFLFQLLVFLLPTQLGYHFWPSWAHVFGIRVDYLAPTVYLTDILIGILLALNLFEVPNYLSTPSSRPKGNSKRVTSSAVKIVSALALAIFVLLNITLAKNPTVAIFKWLKVGELAVFAYLVKKEKDLDINTWIVQPLALSMILFSSIGLVQFLLGHTLGGPWYFLGERNFDLFTSGISHFSFWGRDYLRPYSTFPHPNALAGYFLVALFLIASLLEAKADKEKLIKMSALFLGTTTFLLALSLGAFIAAAAAGIYSLVYTKKKQIFGKIVLLSFLATVFLSLTLPIFSTGILGRGRLLSESAFQRLTLAQSAGMEISKNPPFGVGLNNFILASGRLLQPVHNISLLVLSESGIIGFLLFSFLIIKTLSYLLEIGKSNPLHGWKLVIPILCILITGLVDHYWLTLQQNQLLLSLVFGLSFRGKP